MKDKQAKYPQLRFKGFTDPWEERKLGDISKVIDPHPSHRAPAATEEGIPFIGIGDVNEAGNINYKTARIVDAKIFDEHHNRYDLSIPSIGIGRVASLGKVIRLRDDIGKYVVSPTMSVIQFTNNNDLDFLYSNMNTPIFQKQFKSFSNGSTRQSVGIQDLRILMVSLPVDIEEQQKIGDFFKQLDDTIALHQRKLAKLKELKQGYLQKLFPKNGSKFPQLRFAGFADAWEERKLGELLKSAYQGINTAGDKVIYSEKGVEILQSNHITSGYITFDDTRFLDKKRYSEYFPKYVPKKHDILFANIGTIGPSTVVETNKEFLIAWNILKMTPNENVNSKFIELFLQILNEKHYYEKITTGNATKFVNKNAILNIELCISSFKEQQKIGSFFQQLDNTIALHQRKLEKLQELKKGYLQKMFC